MNFKRKSGPRADDRPALNVLQVSTPVEDNKLIRWLVPKGHLSGFCWRACMVFLGVMYSSDEAAKQRASEVWTETLQSATLDQLQQIERGLGELQTGIIDSRMSGANDDN